MPRYINQRKFSKRKRGDFIMDLSRYRFKFHLWDIRISVAFVLKIPEKNMY